MKINKNYTTFKNIDCFRCNKESNYKHKIIGLARDIGMGRNIKDKGVIRKIIELSVEFIKEGLNSCMKSHVEKGWWESFGEIIDIIDKEGDVCWENTEISILGRIEGEIEKLINDIKEKICQSSEDDAVWLVIVLAWALLTTVRHTQVNTVEVGRLRVGLAKNKKSTYEMLNDSNGEYRKKWLGLYATTQGLSEGVVDKWRDRGSTADEVYLWVGDFDTNDICHRNTHKKAAEKMLETNVVGYALVTGLRIGSLSEIEGKKDKVLVWTRGHKMRCALFTFLDYGVFNHKTSSRICDIFDIVVGKLHAVVRSSIIDIDIERRAGEFNIHFFLESEKLVTANSSVLRSEILPISDLCSSMGNLYINGIDRHQVDVLVALGWMTQDDEFCETVPEGLIKRFYDTCVEANLAFADVVTCSRIVNFAISLWDETGWQCDKCGLDWCSLVLDSLRFCLFLKEGHIPKMVSMIGLNCECIHTWAHIYSDLQFHAGKLDRIGTGDFAPQFEEEFTRVISIVNS